jgi:hypothetical protein
MHAIVNIKYNNSFGMLKNMIKFSNLFYEYNFFTSSYIYNHTILVNRKI